MAEKEIYWRKALSGFFASGLSMRQYCIREQLDYTQARYWRRRLAELEKSGAALDFIELERPEEDSSSGIVMECRGYLLHLNRSFDEATLLRLVGLLRERGH